MSEIALQVNAKLTEFKAMQTTIASLLEEPTTIELVDTTRECVDQMEKDIVLVSLSLSWSVCVLCLSLM